MITENEKAPQIRVQLLLHPCHVSFIYQEHADNYLSHGILEDAAGVAVVLMELKLPLPVELTFPVLNSMTHYIGVS